MKKAIVLILFLTSLLHSANLDIVKSALEQEIRSNYPNIIIIKTQIKPQSLPKDFEAYEFLRLGSGKFNKAGGFLKAVFKTPSNTQKNVFFSYILKANLQVLRARRPIARGDVLNPADFIIATSEFSKVPPNALSLEDTKALIAKANIAKNAILRASMFKANTLIKKNDSVVGILRNGGVDISLELVALSGGQKGDKIRLKNKDGRILQGVIIDNNKVLLE